MQVTLAVTHLHTCAKHSGAWGLPSLDGSSQNLLTRHQTHKERFHWKHPEFVSSGSQESYLHSNNIMVNIYKLHPINWVRVNILEVQFMILQSKPIQKEYNWDFENYKWYLQYQRPKLLHQDCVSVECMWLSVVGVLDLSDIVIC